ncbi:hypothetical protein PQR75_26235 [Paraburkholderia fungorum]|uniref:hypothetical protein n=1 Tax=Paraburkholderia fungorum TaxID=134537 RepID=UPI0038B93C4B
MRTDPRKACANEKQLLGWAVIHDLIAHPFMVLTGYSSVSLRFHDATSRMAWPRDTRTPAAFEFVVVESDRWGPLLVTTTRRGLYQISHPVLAHRFGVNARDVGDAVEQAEEWFASLAELIPGSEVRR